MTTPRLIIFDVDGTLIDSQNVIVSAMNHAFDRAKLPRVSREKALSIVGLSLQEAVSELAPEFPEHHAILTESYKHAFLDERSKGANPPLYPGADAVLRDLASQDWTILGMATGKARRGVEHSLDAYNWRSLFMTTQSADEHPSKPHPSMIEAAMQETGVSVENTVMIGDTVFDMEMGRAAGCHTIGVAWGYHDLARIKPYSDYIAYDFMELKQILDQLWNKTS